MSEITHELSREETHSLHDSLTPFLVFFCLKFSVANALDTPVRIARLMLKLLLLLALLLQKQMQARTYTQNTTPETSEMQSTPDQVFLRLFCTFILTFVSLSLFLSLHFSLLSFSPHFSQEHYWLDRISTRYPMSKLRVKLYFVSNKVTSDNGMSLSPFLANVGC